MRSLPRQSLTPPNLPRKAPRSATRRPAARKWHPSCFLVIMARFLNTSAANYYLEEIIRLAHDRLILISPFLKLNDRIKELLEDKNRLKIDIRIVYGQNELSPEEMNWLRA